MSILHPLINAEKSHAGTDPSLFVVQSSTMTMQTPSSSPPSGVAVIMSQIVVDGRRMTQVAPNNPCVVVVVVGRKGLVYRPTVDAPQMPVVLALLCYSLARYKRKAKQRKGRLSNKKEG